LAILGTDRHQKNIAGFRAPQGIGLDRACRTITFLVTVVDFDQQPIGAGKPDGLDEGRAA